MGENMNGVDCRTASFLPRYDCAQQLQADVIFFCLHFKLTRRYCVNCMAINNNLEPGGNKEFLRNIKGGVKKALYICQALTAVIFCTWWDLQGQAQHISCSSVCFIVQCAGQPGLVVVWAQLMFFAGWKLQSERFFQGSVYKISGGYHCLHGKTSSFSGFSYQELVV